MEKIIERDDGRTVHFLVWDTAGQEEFDALTRSYYSGACCINRVAIESGRNGGTTNMSSSWYHALSLLG